MADAAVAAFNWLFGASSWDLVVKYPFLRWLIGAMGLLLSGMGTSIYYGDNSWESKFMMGVLLLYLLVWLGRPPSRS